MRRSFAFLIISILGLVGVTAGCSTIRSEPSGMMGTFASETISPMTSTISPGKTNTLVIDPLPTGSKALQATPTAILIHPVPISPALTDSFEFFGTIIVQPDFEIDGQGENIDSIAFWEAPDPTGTFMYVTSKANQLVEVWKYPFEDHEQTPIRGIFGSGQVNGIVVDQEADLLYVSQSKESSSVYVFSISLENPHWELIETFSGPDLGSEPNVGLLHHTNGGTWLYVTDSKRGVYVWDVGSISRGASPELITDFSASDLESIETILADDYDQVIYLPDENGRTGINAYNPDGTPYLKNNASRFGDQGIFQSDEEGILIYKCLSDNGGDTGRGWIVVADQRDDLTDFEFFDRGTWEHLGTLRIEGVSNTDGIASTQQPLPDYLTGIFAAVNDDETTVGVGWDKIFTATGLSCGSP